MLESRGWRILVTSVLVIIGIYFLFKGLAEAKPVLMPIAIASLLAMMFLPVSRFLERRGLKRAWAAFLCSLLLFLLVGGLMLLLSVQVKKMAENWPELKKNIEQQRSKAEEWIREKTGVQVSDYILSQYIGGKSNDNAPESPSGSNEQNERVKKVAVAAMSFFGNLILIIVYVFFMLSSRAALKEFVIRMVKSENRDEARRTITESAQVAGHYLAGRSLLVLVMGVMYVIGLSIIGLKQALLVSVIGAILYYIPYIGNLIAYIIALAFALLQGSDLQMLVWITVFGGGIQLIETYTLEPYVMSHQVNLRPIFVVLSVVIGGLMWGAAGTIIAIPLLAMLKVVCDHVPALEAYGYLLGLDSKK